MSKIPTGYRPRADAARHLTDRSARAALREGLQRRATRRTAERTGLAETPAIKPDALCDPVGFSAQIAALPQRRGTGGVTSGRPGAPAVRFEITEPIEEA